MNLNFKQYKKMRWSSLWILVWVFFTMLATFSAKSIFGKEWVNVFIGHAGFSLLSLGMLSYLWLAKEQSKRASIIFAFTIIAIHTLVYIRTFTLSWYSFNDAIIGLYLETFIECIVVAIFLIAKILSFQFQKKSNPEFSKGNYK